MLELWANSNDSRFDITKTPNKKPKSMTWGFYVNFYQIINYMIKSDKSTSLDLGVSQRIKKRVYFR